MSRKESKLSMLIYRLDFVILLILNFIIISCSSFDTEKLELDSREHGTTEIHDLIIKAVKWFPTNADLISEGYEPFLRKTLNNRIVFKSHRDPDVKFETELSGRDVGDDSIVIIKDGDHPHHATHSHDSDVHIVMIKARKTKKTYTAHKAYIREIEGMKSVEWDAFRPSHTFKRKSFFSAMAPYEEYESNSNTRRGHDEDDDKPEQDKSQKIKKKPSGHKQTIHKSGSLSNTRHDEDEDQDKSGRFFGTGKFFGEIKKKIHNAFHSGMHKVKHGLGPLKPIVCLVTFHIPEWCRAYDPSFHCIADGYYPYPPNCFKYYHCYTKFFFQQKVVAKCAGSGRAYFSAVIRACVRFDPAVRHPEECSNGEIPTPPPTPSPSELLTTTVRSIDESTTTEQTVNDPFDPNALCRWHYEDGAFGHCDDPRLKPFPCVPSNESSTSTKNLPICVHEPEIIEEETTEFAIEEPTELPIDDVTTPSPEIIDAIGLCRWHYGNGTVGHCTNRWKPYPCSPRDGTAANLPVCGDETGPEPEEPTSTSRPIEDETDAPPGPPGPPSPPLDEDDLSPCRWHYSDGTYGPCKDLDDKPYPCAPRDGNANNLPKCGEHPKPIKTTTHSPIETSTANPNPSPGPRPPDYDPNSPCVWHYDEVVFGSCKHLSKKPYPCNPKNGNSKNLPQCEKMPPPITPTSSPTPILETTTSIHPTTTPEPNTLTTPSDRFMSTTTIVPIYTTTAKETPTTEKYHDYSSEEESYIEPRTHGRSSSTKQKKSKKPNHNKHSSENDDSEDHNDHNDHDEDCPEGATKSGSDCSCSSGEIYDKYDNQCISVKIKPTRKKKVTKGRNQNGDQDNREIKVPLFSITIALDKKKGKKVHRKSKAESFEDVVSTTVGFDAEMRSTFDKPTESPSNSMPSSSEKEKESKQHIQRMKGRTFGPRKHPESDEQRNIYYDDSSMTYECPSGSGAILVGNRCYCPKGTALNNRKCIPKKQTKKAKDADDYRDQRPKSTAISNAQADAANSDDGGEQPHKRHDAKFQQKDSRESYPAPIKSHKKKNKISAFSDESESGSDEKLKTHINFPKPLGNLYSKALAMSVENEEMKRQLNSLPKDDLHKIIKNTSIGNDKRNGHPLFESLKTPFTGLMNCDFKVKRLKDFTSSTENNFVDYFLHTLRAQCHKKIRRNTLDFFHSEVVKVHMSPKFQKSRIELNFKSGLLNQRILNPKDWERFISGIFLAKYSEAFYEQLEKLDEGIDDNLSSDNQPISQSVRTLTVFVERVMVVLRHEQFRRHAVKITSALLKTISDWAQKTVKQQVILEIFCRACHSEMPISKEDLKHLDLLSKYVIFSAPDAIRDFFVTFDEFYSNNVQNSN